MKKIHIYKAGNYDDLCFPSKEAAGEILEYEGYRFVSTSPTGVDIYEKGMERIRVKHEELNVIHSVKDFKDYKKENQNLPKPKKVTKLIPMAELFSVGSSITPEDIDDFYKNEELKEKRDMEYIRNLVKSSTEETCEKTS